MKKLSVIFHNLHHALLIGGVVAAMAVSASPASAIPITTSFNFVPTGTLIANTGDVTTALSITSGAPLLITGILSDNTGLVSGVTNVILTNPTPTTLGSIFTKTFQTSLGTFVETLTVTLVTPGPTSLGITAQGTIVQTVVLSGAQLESAPVFYSAAYTQNTGPGGQINASFNNSTTPPTNVPEPASLPLLGIGLLTIGALVRQQVRMRIVG
jgi:hypothetical protein